MKLIHAHVYDPRQSLFKPTANDKAECRVIQCSNSENCGLFARGECSLFTVFPCGKCPYGTYGREVGFTKKASKFSSWIREKKKEYSDCLNKLNHPRQVMAVVGDYVFLPYAFMDKNQAVTFKGRFLLKADFTIDNIIKICEFVPQALFGGAINSYQKEEIPKFLNHLSENMPEVFSELCKHYDRAKTLEVNHVGRKAILQTITPNEGKLVDIHGGEWIWDGEYLTSCNSHASFMLVSDFTEVRIKPLGSCEIKITDLKQVNPNTKFMS